MKTNAAFVLILLFSVCFTATAQKGLKETFWENGQLRSQGKLDKAGLKTGVWKSWHENGQLETSHEYKKNEKLDGQWIRFHDNGAIAEQGEYLGNFKTGEWKCFFPDSSIQSITNHQDRYKEGWFIEYFSNGIEKMRGQYRQDKKVGLWEERHENNQLKLALEYVNGQLVTTLWKEFHDNGVIKLQGSLLNGLKEGEWVRYRKTGEKKSIMIFEKGKLLSTEDIPLIEEEQSTPPPQENN